ncbi:hypothetical protein HER14_01250 [Acidithiobacillus thiooxidans]|nr:hypothetical protein [Acidithiobacillus thiooxidans]
MQLAFLSPLIRFHSVKQIVACVVLNLRRREFGPVGR